MTRTRTTPRVTISDRVLETSYGPLLLWWLGGAVVFAFLYFILASVPGNGPTNLTDVSPFLRFLDCLYFSIITATSTGYGDIVPQGISKLFAALESLSSIIVLAVVVAKFASKKQEIALEHIHELTVDSGFHAIRQGLFIARKDLDTVMTKVQSREPLTHTDWRNLHISFRQMEVFIAKIPGLYSLQQGILAMDADRERLLLDAVERTLERVSQSLDIFERQGVDYMKELTYVQALKKVSIAVEQIFVSHKNKIADQENAEAFQSVLTRMDEILRHIERFAEHGRA